MQAVENETLEGQQTLLGVLEGRMKREVRKESEEEGEGGEERKREKEWRRRDMTALLCSSPHLHSSVALPSHSGR